MNNLIKDRTFRERASDPKVWNSIQRDIDALILSLGLTGNYAVPFHSNAQHNIMDAFGQTTITNNGHALDVALSAAEYAAISENPIARDIKIPKALTQYGNFLSKIVYEENPVGSATSNRISQLVDTCKDGRIKRRILEQSMPSYFDSRTSGYKEAEIEGFRAKKIDLINNPEKFAEAYKKALFETATLAIFTKGLGMNYATAPTGVFSREAAVRNGKVILFDNSDVITESQAVDRAKTLCDLLLNSEDFELSGTKENPNLPYDIAAIRLALNYVQERLYPNARMQPFTYREISLPTPAIKEM